MKIEKTHQLFSSLGELFKQTVGRTSLRRDLESIYLFYLSSREREQLARMSFFKRHWFLALWFFKSILAKLSRVRRLLLIVAFVLLLAPDNHARPGVAFIFLFAILILELKDKLLAHDELRAGQAVQSALRPQKCPDIEGWEVFFYTRSANHVGGDLIDCFTLAEGQTLFTLGDVSGKGLAAALLMAQLQAGTRVLAHQKSNGALTTLLQELNQHYCRSGLAQSFISFIALEIEPHCGTIRFANAGHLPPLHISGKNVRELAKGGPALGLSAKATFAEERIELERDDFLFVYTDGVTDARNELGNFYGDERLLRNLRENSGDSARALGEKMVNYLDVFVGQAPRNDDATFMILKRKNEEIIDDHSRC